MSALGSGSDGKKPGSSPYALWLLNGGGEETADFDGTIDSGGGTIGPDLPDQFSRCALPGHRVLAERPVGKNYLVRPYRLAR